MNKETILEIVEDENISFFWLQFCDIFGVSKSVEIPRSELETALDGKIIFDGSSIKGFMRIEETDMYLEPDLDTFLILPWEEATKGKTARLICDVISMDKKAFEGDPRQVLKRQIAKLQKLGYDDFFVGFEPEFYLFRKDDKGNPLLEVVDNSGYFDLSPEDLEQNIRREIVLELQQSGFNIEAAHHEVGAGQHEINFKFTNALAACDALQTYKMIVKMVAKRHNLHATFMAKPLYGKAGNGMHTNCSLKKNNKNAFFDESAELQLSDECRQFMAGIIKNARAFTAVTNPSVNSYKRLVPGYEAPCYISWSPANRSTFLRIPATRGATTRIEIRSVDAMANPYLAIAVIVASGMEGLMNKLSVSPPTYENLFALSRAERERMEILNLPSNLYDAIKELRKSELMQTTLGEHCFEMYVKNKLIEWERYTNQVHQWEVDEYLTRY